jgi:hypothetical protein
LLYNDNTENASSTLSCPQVLWAFVILGKKLLETKVCPLCGEEKSWSEFGVNNSKKACTGGIQSYCKPCGKLNSQLRLHNMTKEQFFRLIWEQKGKCAICKDSLYDLYTESGTRNIHIDHDHDCCPTVKSCGHCTRGILCGSCNKMLGFARDNQKILLAGAEYLEALKGGDEQDVVAF